MHDTDRVGMYCGAFALGLAVGAAALTRSEGLLLVLLLLPFAVRRAGPRRLRHLALAVAGTALLVVPWSIRTSLVFHRPVTISTGDGAVLAGSNAHSTYYGWCRPSRTLVSRRSWNKLREQEVQTMLAYAHTSPDQSSRELAWLITSMASDRSTEPIWPMPLVMAS